MSIIKQKIYNNSVLFYLLRTIKGEIEARKKKLKGKYAWDYDSIVWDKKPLLKNHTLLMSNTLNEYEKRLKILIKKVLDYNSTPIFVTQTTRLYKNEIGVIYGVNSVKTIESDRLHNMEGKYNNQKSNNVDKYFFQTMMNDKLMEICEEFDCICIDLANEINFDMKNDFYDSVHSTPSGAEKIGKFLYQKLNHLF